ncbi:protease inhibitor I42 family protein [Nocardia arizonensis]|uniref:protease inhibitor I42 family protein n=1 Tax=Nocardia arizonensis TaxID=1141647 RepID=UPI0006D18B71|nr:protease inhibitor I42 family protein [Nocardia arizonensis]
MRSSVSVAVLLTAGLTGCAAKGDTRYEVDDAAAARVAQARGGGAAVAVTEADNGGMRRLAIGQRLTVSLPWNPSTGYTWRLGQLDRAVVGQGREAEVGEDSAVPEPFGGEGGQTWTFTGNAAGSSPLVMEYARPWEHSVEPARIFTVTIEVS